jgi:transcriptional regulator with XRE-family HTH domain
MKLNDFGKRMKQLRKQRKLSQSRMGALLGLHYIHVGRYESGKALPSVDTLVSISKKLNVTLDWLIFGEEVASHVDDGELRYLLKELMKLDPGDRVEAKKLIADFIFTHQTPNPADLHEATVTSSVLL